MIQLTRKVVDGLGRKNQRKHTTNLKKYLQVNLQLYDPNKPLILDASKDGLGVVDMKGSERSPTDKCADSKGVASYCIWVQKISLTDIWKDIDMCSGKRS